MQDINRPYLRWLIIVGLLEGFSTLALFCIAMPMKYWYDTPMHVTIVGPVHGLLFIALVMMFWIGKAAVPLPTRLVVWGMVGAVIPFVPFIVDVPLYKMLQSEQPV